MRRAEDEGHFAIIPHDLLNHTDISWAAKGLQCNLLQHAESWKIHTSYLVQKFSGGRDMVRKLISELMLYGYITKEQPKSVNGKFAKSELVIHRKQVELKNRTLPKSEKILTLTTQLALRDEIINSQYINELKFLSNPATQVKAPRPETPATESPASDSPAPVDPTLTIISNNNNKQKQKQEEESRWSVGTAEKIEPVVASSVFIFERLSLEQRQIIEAQLLASEISYGHYGVATWLAAIEFELLDLNSFKNANQEFSHKLNIIFSMAKVARWTPAGYVARKEKESAVQHQKLQQDLSIEIRNKKSEISHYEKLILNSPTELQRKLMRQQILMSTKSLKSLELTLNNSRPIHPRQSCG
jgi:hypothetical protein